MSRSWPERKTRATGKQTSEKADHTNSFARFEGLPKSACDPFDLKADHHFGESQMSQSKIAVLEEFLESVFHLIPSQSNGKFSCFGKSGERTSRSKPAVAASGMSAATQKAGP
jgi:hypothetical protein